VSIYNLVRDAHFAIVSLAPSSPFTSTLPVLVIMDGSKAHPEVFEVHPEEAWLVSRSEILPLRVPTHTYDILIACAPIFIPMTVFTLVALIVVFANTVSNPGCSKIYE
jgi:hypothetical protein